MTVGYVNKFINAEPLPTKIYRRNTFRKPAAQGCSSHDQLILGFWRKRVEATRHSSCRVSNANIL